MSAGVAVAQAARALLAAAKDHKRAARMHRDAARRCMQDLAQLQAQCASIGIKLEMKGEAP